MKFREPQGQSGIDWKSLHGSLVMMWGTRVEKDVHTRHGVKDVVVGEVHVLDGEQAGQAFHDAWIWPSVLQSELRPLIGTDEGVLGRVALGAATGGRSAPWILDKPTDEDREKGAKHDGGLGDGALGRADIGENGDGIPPSDDEPPF